MAFEVGTPMSATEYNTYLLANSHVDDTWNFTDTASLILNPRDKPFSFYSQYAGPNVIITVTEGDKALDQEDQFGIEFLDEEETFIFRWFLNEAAPTLNTAAFGYSFDESEVNGKTVKTYSIVVGTSLTVERNLKVIFYDGVGVANPRTIRTQIRKAPTVNSGEKIKIWNANFNGFESGVITRQLANAMRLGSEAITGNGTIIFNANGGSGTMTSQEIPNDTSANLTANSFTYTAKNFTGWNTLADGTGTAYADGASYSMSFLLDQILYAQWEDIP